MCGREGAAVLSSSQEREKWLLKQDQHTVQPPSQKVHLHWKGQSNPRKGFNWEIYISREHFGGNREAKEPWDTTQRPVQEQP